MRHRIKGLVEARLSRSTIRREECGAAPSRRQATQTWNLKMNDTIGAKHQYPVGNEQRLRDVMGNEQRRRTCHELRKLVIEPCPRDGIERGERFVEKQERGLSYQSTSEGNATALATRDLRRVPLQQLSSTNDLERRLRSRPSAWQRFASQLEWEGHIAKHRTPR
jgi:hypothetical protein